MEEIFKRVERFHSQFLAELEAVYNNCSDVKNILAWFNRFDQLTAALERGDGSYRQIEDHIFELQVINFLLTTFTGCNIIYEPKGKTRDGKNCDLEVEYEGKKYLVEIKCFHSEWKETKIPEEHIAENNVVSMGGGIYHSYQATRGHLMDVTHHTEQKIDNYEGDYISVLATPVGFHLSLEDLRDFVFIYRHKEPRADDPLGPMTMHNLKEPFKQSIEEFWAIPIPQESFDLKKDSEVIVVAPLIQDDKVLEL